jgi:hypothetical protein
LEHKLEELQKIIFQQQEKIDEMQNKINELSDYILRLSVCKVTNPKYPYYDFIVSYQISPEKQDKIDLLFILLSDKFNGKKIQERFRKIKDYPTDFLFSNEPLKYKDVKEALAKILGAISDEVPLMLIKNLRDQGFHVALCDYLLSQCTADNQQDE